MFSVSHSNTDKRTPESGGTQQHVAGKRGDGHGAGPELRGLPLPGAQLGQRETVT